MAMALAVLVLTATLVLCGFMGWASSPAERTAAGAVLIGGLALAVLLMALHWTEHWGW
jgi:hypothetical protein